MNSTVKNTEAGKIETNDTHIVKYIKSSYFEEFLMESFVLLNTSNHPHINAVVSDDISFDESYYIIRMKKHKPLVNLTFQVIWDVVSGFVYLHEVLHVIHYDLHSYNICIDDNGRGILIDFGNSKIITRTDSYDLYNVCYRPPEVYSSKRHHCVSDIWALGMMWLNEQFDIRVVRDLFSVLYANKESWSNAYFKCIFTRKLNKLIKQIPKTHRSGSHDSYEWIIRYMFEDKDEVYLQFLDLYIEEQSIELQELYHEIIRHMLRYDVTKRITARQLFHKLVVYNDSHNLQCIVPILLGSTLHDQQPLNSIKDDKQPSSSIEDVRRSSSIKDGLCNNSIDDGLCNNTNKVGQQSSSIEDGLDDNSTFRVELAFDSYNFDFGRELDISLNLNQTMFVNQIVQNTKNINRQFIEYFVQKGFINNSNFVQYIKMYNTIKSTIYHIDRQLHYIPHSIIVNIVKHWFPFY